jgi:putative oxidoreductase
MSDSATLQPRAMTIGLWVFRVLVAAFFLFAAIQKLTGAQMEVDLFQVVGLGQWFRYLTGLLEVAGGVMLLAPTISAFGALILLLVDVGAFIAQVTVLHQDWVHTVVIGVVLVGLVYFQRRQIIERLR